MSDLTCASNIVKKDILREVQKTTLDDLSNILINSFGPNGSTTCIKKDNVYNMYTKDGHNILKEIKYNGVIQQSIKDDVESITRHIVKTVGDGTTSAVILANEIFKSFIESEALSQYHPADILRTFQKTVNDIKERIKKNGREATIDDMYNISMISADGNTEVATVIYEIYKQFGLDAFIDVTISNSVDSKIKIYDGMTLDVGFADSCYVNNKEKNSVDIRNPRIYFFEDPIDTREMSSFLDAIVYHNIIGPLNGQGGEVIPTVIISSRVTKDMSTTLDTIITEFSRVTNPALKPPFLLISNFNNDEVFDDVAKLCGGKTIHKYIDPNIQAVDIANGKAPTPETISDEWFGTCDEVSADSTKTKFINPCLMKDENDEFTPVYMSLLGFLEAEIEKCTLENEDARTVGNFKRRLNSLKGNMVEYLVGGITMADRDSVRDLVEDSVKNTRSAAINGVGRASNFEAYSAICEENKLTNESLNIEIINILLKAYTNLIKRLYKNSISDDSMYNDIIETALYKNEPIDLRTLKFTGKVLSSIESDVIILDTVSKIVGLMITTNQFIVPSPMHNIYTNFNN